MKKIWVAYTNQERILAIDCPTGIAKILENNERIVNSWFYYQPRELESFIIANPNKKEYLLKALSYWVINKVMGFKEEQNRYGPLKRELKKFNAQLFKTLRAIAGKIAMEIKKFLNPKRPKKIY